VDQPVTWTSPSVDALIELTAGESGYFQLSATDPEGLAVAISQACPIKPKPVISVTE
jgi:hypothetical protein